jgi:uncharacterized protein (UPF0276 family)
MQPRALGVALMWWPELDSLCRDGEGLVDAIELEPETFWAPGSQGRPTRSHLGAAVAHLTQPKLLHGVAAPLGGVCSAPAEHAGLLARDIAEIRPQFISEHLSFTHFRPQPDSKEIFSGFLLPPSYSSAGVALAAGNIRRRRAALGGIPIAVETTVDYLPAVLGAWPPDEFVAAVAEDADCGILLDLHNLLCNARNGGLGVQAFCEGLPLERVWEIHLAGGELESGFFTDAHSGLVEPELMEAAATLIASLPNLQAVTFEIMPERVAQVGLNAIARQLGAMQDLWASRALPRNDARKNGRMRPSTDPPIDPETWESLLGCAILGLPQPPIAPEIASWLTLAAPAIDLYRALIGEGRAGAVTLAAPSTIRLILKECGEDGARRLLGEFWRGSPPSSSAADEAHGFLRFLSTIDPAPSGLGAAMRADLAKLAQL